MDTLTLFFSIAAKTLDATPIVPRIPEPINAIIETPGVTSNFLIIFDSNLFFLICLKGHKRLLGVKEQGTVSETRLLAACRGCFAAVERIP